MGASLDAFSQPWRLVTDADTAQRVLHSPTVGAFSTAYQFELTAQLSESGQPETPSAVPA
jgi:hypothetical protein